jgi:glycerophosphoryl diester phosphodiesterase
VVIHDGSVDRTTDGTGKVANLTLAEIQAFDAGNGERIPTLTQTLDVIAGRSKLDIEVKAVAAAAAVLREVARYPDLEWLISSFRWNALEYVREQHATAELWVLDNAASDESVRAARKVKASLLNLEYPTVTREQIEAFKAEGFDVGVWTVNDPVEAGRLRDIGVVAICTDDPAALKDVYA